MKNIPSSTYVPDDKLEIVWKNNKCGFINTETQEVIVPCIYDDATEFTRGLSIVCIEKYIRFYSQDGNKTPINKKYGLINNKGEQITHIVYDSIEEDALACNRILFSKNGKYGFLNREGKEVIPATYNEAGFFCEGLSAVLLKDKCGYIDEQGNVVIPFRYESARGFVEGVAAVSQSRKWGVIDKEGKQIVPFIYDDIHSFFHGHANVCMNQKWGIIDRQGKVTTLCIYDDIIQINNGTFVASLDKKWGLIDENKNVIVPFIYDQLFPYPGAMFFDVERDGKRGRIDLLGNIIIPLIYDEIYPIQDNIFVEKDGKCGVIDNHQNVLIPLEYKSRCYLTGNEEWLYLRKAGKCGAFNLRNNKKIPFIYDDMDHFFKGRARVKKADEIYYIDFDNNRLPLIPRPTKYSNIRQILSPHDILVKNPFTDSSLPKEQRMKDICEFYDQIISHSVENVRNGKYPLLEDAIISAIPSEYQRDIQSFTFTFKDFDIQVIYHDDKEDDEDEFMWISTCGVYVSLQCNIRNINKDGLKIPRYIKALEIDTACEMVCLEETLDIIFTEISKCKKKYLEKREK